MKKFFAVLLLMIGMVVFTNANLSKTAIKVHANAQIGDYSDDEFGCPDCGCDCEHLPPVVIK